ncbi:hypothetical protein ACHAQD_008424 [Fusarium lateritium]
MSSTNAPAVPGNPSSRSDKPFLLPNSRAAKNADQQTWFPAEYRSHPTRFDADTLSKIVRITQLAVNHHVPLASLWAPGGALARSVSGVPPKLTRKEAGFALERLREDIQAANPLQTIVQQHVDDLGDDDPDSGFFDVGGSDDEDPDDTQGETSIAKTTSLAHKILPQLKYNVCLTDDVLQFLTTVIHSHSESDSHLMDGGWLPFAERAGVVHGLFQWTCPLKYTKVRNQDFLIGSLTNQNPAVHLAPLKNSDCLSWAMVWYRGCRSELIVSIFDF